MSEPIAGKFLLEILTKGMYSNPMHVYREYIQNSSDSIDKAIESGVLQAAEAEIHIFIDDRERNIVIKDNGLGIPLDIAKIKLMNVGASDKDGVTERGFRGIGRLGGLAYAEKVQFVTSAVGDSVKTIMTCDCVRMQQLLQKSNNETSDIMETFKAISAFEEQPEESEKHYFEVRLIGVPKESGLLDENNAIRYLAETAPIDFDSQQFVQARKIREHFAEKGFPITCYKILRGARRKPIYKLYSRSMSTGKQERTKTKDYVRDVEFIYREASDGKPLYIGWLAITDFSGIISDESVQGIRFRKGNILVGNGTTFSKNLTTWEEVYANLSILSDMVAVRLRKYNLYCTGVQVTIRDAQFHTITRQKQLSRSTHLSRELADACMELTRQSWHMPNPIRMLTVTALHPVPAEQYTEQLDLFSASPPEKKEKLEKLETTMDQIRSKFGSKAISYGSAFHKPALSNDASPIRSSAKGSED